MGSMPRCWPMASSLTQFLKLHSWVTKSPSFMHSEKRWIWTWRLEEEEDLKESEGYYNNKSPFSCLFVSSCSCSSSSSRNSSLNNNLIRIRFRADIHGSQRQFITELFHQLATCSLPVSYPTHKDTSITSWVHAKLMQLLRLDDNILSLLNSNNQ